MNYKSSNTSSNLGNKRPLVRWARMVGWACITLGLIYGSAIGQEAIDDNTDRFFETYCLRCHNDTKQEGDFRLDRLDTDFTNPLIAQKWGEVLFRINAGEMPPLTEKLPTPQEIARVADDISNNIRAGAAARMAQRGLVQHYRLSRQEYSHTVYDLLGVVFDVEAPGAFNEDPRWQGFDRVGSLLSTAPSHVDRYFDAADAVVSSAFPDVAIPTKTDRKLVGEGKRVLLQLGEGWGFHLEHSGRYRIRIRASGLPAFTGRVPHLALWHGHHKRSFGGVDHRAEETAPQTIELTGIFPAGPYVVRNHARTVKHANGGIQLFRNETIDAMQPVAALTGGHRSPWTKVVDGQGRPTMPLLLIDWIEIEGPLLSDADRANRVSVFPSEEDGLQTQQVCLKRFAERAWRRPVSDLEIEPYARLVASEQAAGEPYRAAYRSGLASILIARSFFNLEEGSPHEDRPHLNDFELASRLSYFLWSSMPDDQLFAAARDGKLRSRETLAKQLNRMLADPKIDRFLNSFSQQWLQLHRVGMFQPDPELYPEYGPWLEESMVQETTAYFSEMFRKDLPLREAVDSSWTMLNSRLALHYRLSRPKSLGMTRVELTSDSGRGGILTHASVLSLTSDGTRHRPVHRGAWVAEAIMAYTPPPPPPNVDPLEPTAENERKTTIRSKLEAHATTTNCVSCHAKIDPLGLAFENYDAIGRWRDVERVETGIGEHPPVDASGRLPDGRTFTGPTEFKKLLAEDQSRLAEAFLEQLATYALRRVMTVDDMEQLRSISESSESNEFGVQTLVRELVMSDLFQKR